MSAIHDRLREKYPDGIPVNDPDQIAEKVAAAARHLPEGAITADVAALQEATADNDREKQILILIAMATKVGLRIVFPG